MAAYEQAGNFQVLDLGGRLKKDGGNVASYFCTADGRVIHAALGPVDANELIAEADWAVQSFLPLALAGPVQQAEQMSLAHGSAVRRHIRRKNTSPGAQIHQLLAERPLPRLHDVSEEVFSKILGETVRQDASKLERAEQAVDLARVGGLPLLFMLHQNANDDVPSQIWRELLAKQGRMKQNVLPDLVRSFVVVLLPLSELPAMSAHLGVAPYSAPNGVKPVFVVARSNGQQVDAVTGWANLDQLAQAMARGLVAEVQQRRLSSEELGDLLRLVERVDEKLALPIRVELLEEDNRRRQQAVL